MNTLLPMAIRVLVVSLILITGCSPSSRKEKSQAEQLLGTWHRGDDRTNEGLHFTMEGKATVSRVVVAAGNSSFSKSDTGDYMVVTGKNYYVEFAAVNNRSAIASFWVAGDSLTITFPCEGTKFYTRKKDSNSEQKGK